MIKHNIFYINIKSLTHELHTILEIYTSHLRSRPIVNRNYKIKDGGRHQSYHKIKTSVIISIQKISFEKLYSGIHLEKLHIKFNKFILGIHQRTKNVAVLSERCPMLSVFLYIQRVAIGLENEGSHFTLFKQSVIRFLRI